MIEKIKIEGGECWPFFAIKVIIFYLRLNFFIRILFISCLDVEMSKKLQ